VFSPSKLQTSKLLQNKIDHDLGRRWEKQQRHWETKHEREKSLFNLRLINFFKVNMDILVS